MEALLVLTPLALGRAARLAEAAESGALKASGANPATVRVYRVEGVANARIVIGEGGTVAIVDSGRMLFLNFGSRARAEELLARRVAQGMEGAATKSFEVPKSFLDDLRSSAVPERLARKYPGRPIEVDVSAAPDQFGLRAEQIEELRKAIIQGTGEVTK
jgi:filamentous hemagglutinin